MGIFNVSPIFKVEWEFITSKFSDKMHYKLLFNVSYVYLKQNEYLSHPNLVSKCIGHNALKKYLTSHLYLKQNE